MISKNITILASKIIITIFFFFIFLISSTEARRRQIKILENHPVAQREASDSHRFRHKPQQTTKFPSDDSQNSVNNNDPLSSQLLSYRSLMQLKIQRQIEREQLLSKRNEHFLSEIPTATNPITTQDYHSSLVSGKYHVGGYASRHQPPENSPAQQQQQVIAKKEALVSQLFSQSSNSNKLSVVDKIAFETVGERRKKAEAATGFPNGGGYNSYNNFANSNGVQCSSDEVLRVDFSFDPDGDGKLYGNTWGSGFTNIEAGDFFEYEIMWLTEHCNCGTEIEGSNDWRLRDHAPLDEKGFSPHSEKNANMSQVAFKKWHKRRWNIHESMLRKLNIDPTGTTTPTLYQTYGGSNSLYVERFLFSAYAPPGNPSKASALFRNIRIIKIDPQTGIETIKKNIWVSGEAGPPQVQNTFFKGAFTSSCQSPLMVNVLKRAGESSWKNFPLRRGETSRLLFGIGITDFSALEDDENDEFSTENDESRLSHVCCNRAFYFEENDEDGKCKLSNGIIIDSLYLSLSRPLAVTYFRHIAWQKEQQVQIETFDFEHKKRLPPTTAATNNEKNSTNSVFVDPEEDLETIFVHKWKKVYNPERYQLSEYSGIFILNWTARLRHSKFADITFWDLVSSSANSRQQEREEEDLQLLSPQNFSACGDNNANDDEKDQKAISPSVSQIGCSLLKLQIHRDNYRRHLQKLRSSIEERIVYLQSLSAEAKVKVPNSVQEWAAKHEELKIVKLDLDDGEADLEWDQHLMSILYSAFSRIKQQKQTKIKNKHRLLFPLLDSIDFPIPSDDKMFFLLKKNIIPSSPQNQKRNFNKETELEIAVSFLKLKLMVTKQKRGEDLENEFEDIHVKEIRIQTAKLLDSEF